MAVAAIPALLAGRSHAAASELTLDDILARHTAARGGAAALDAVHAMVATIDIGEGDNTVNARYQATIGDLMRIDVYARGTRVWSEGVDHNGAWNLTQDAHVAAESPAGAAALRHGILFNLYGLHRLAPLGHRLSLGTGETIAGTRYRVIEIVLADGFQTFLYIDPESWMITRRRDIRALHPDVDPKTKWLENEYDDFRPVAGVMTSFRSSQTDLTAAKIVQTTAVRALGYNSALDEATFARDHVPLPV